MNRKHGKGAGSRESTPLTMFGAGRFARAMLPLLAQAGYPPLAIAARRLSSARAASRLAPGSQATTCLETAVGDAALISLAVPDREIAPLARRLAGASGIDWRGRVVLHHAGSLGIEPLSPLAERGAALGVLHPLQCLGSPELTAAVLPGSRARVEGDRRGRPAAARLARALGMIPLRFPASSGPDQRAAYHAAASLLSNDVVALLSIGLDLLADSGVPRAQALDGLVSLARGTLLQAGRHGIGGALTGPASRGDVETLERHSKQLRRLGCGAEIHRLLSLRLAALARERGSTGAALVERALAAPGRSPNRTV